MTRNHRIQYALLTPLLSALSIALCASGKANATPASGEPRFIEAFACPKSQASSGLCLRGEAPLGIDVVAANASRETCAGKTWKQFVFVNHDGRKIKATSVSGAPCAPKAPLFFAFLARKEAHIQPVQLIEVQDPARIGALKIKLQHLDPYPYLGGYSNSSKNTPHRRSDLKPVFLEFEGKGKYLVQYRAEGDPRDTEGPLDYFTGEVISHLAKECSRTAGAFEFEGQHYFEVFKVKCESGSTVHSLYRVTSGAPKLLTTNEEP